MEPVAGNDPAADFALLLDDVKQLFKVRQHLLRAEKRIFNHMGAIIGWKHGESDAEEGQSPRVTLYPGIPSAPDIIPDDDNPADLTDVLADKWKGSVLDTLRQSHDTLKARRMWNEKQLEKAAKRLPVWPWVQQTRGLSALGLGLIVGAGQTENGSIFDAPNPAKVWKRFGLGLVNGERQRRVATDAALAIEHGYSPSRRAIMFTVGTSMAMSKGVLYPLFIERKDQELSKLIARDGETKNKGQKKHAQMRAQRYIQKRLLVMLWREWQRTIRAAGLTTVLPPSVTEA